MRVMRGVKNHFDPPLLDKPNYHSVAVVYSMISHIHIPIFAI